MGIGQISALGAQLPQSSYAPPVEPSNSPSAPVVAPSAPAPTSVQQSVNAASPIGAANATPADESQALKQSVDTINAYLNSVGNNIEFSIDHTTGQVVVQVVDTQTQTVLMQTPSKQALAIA